ncbi:hypothetical protein OB69_00375 [Roseivirga seohaensis subsp. aquiponti]|uniref:DUF5666 domain-containing protein n=1 Tax=Roseivirga seohaensis subsp. aquiponti TaxID=1566026 RepID=A0A0L8AQ39_9BACT|nr:hypothetical protein [Roseivirga seohaensis]KOF04553.1 hypothetical protein OB69_00375 [Roseivirga seohaensis subsp. aquiponti]
MIKSIISKSALFLGLITAPFLSANAQDEGFIYGKLTTIDGNSYTGQMRWGDRGEGYWTDHFNGNKEENDNYRHLTREERNDLRDEQRRRNSSWGSFSISWGNNSWETTHEFRTEFGNISRIDINRRSEVELTLRNGDRVFVKDGSDDMGGTITILDQELGSMKFNWSRIETIEFMDTPSKLANKIGDPIYGTVEYYGGSITGFVQWDHDERYTTNVLDGDTRDGDMKIEFGNIKSIERDRSGSNVVTKSGRELYLRGSNDVDNSNGGIIVSTDFGRVDIPWKEFKRVEFTNAPNSGKAYSDYEVKKISGTVETTKGETLSGEIIFDLDEEYNFEIIQGEDDDIEYFIPIENIKSFSPRNYDNARIVLKSGKELTLGSGRDVSDENEGVLVFNSSGKPTYVKYANIKQINFK